MPWENCEVIKIYVFDQNGIKYKNMDTIRLLGSQEKIHGLVESGFREKEREIYGDLNIWETGCIC